MEKNKIELKRVNRYIHYIQYEINNWTCRVKPEFNTLKIVQNLINSHKKMLGDKLPIGAKWLKSNPIIIIKYYYHILSYLERFDDVKIFTLAPIFDVKNHFITIDNKVLYHIMNNYDEKVKDVIEEYNESIKNNKNKFILFAPRNILIL